MMALWVGIAQVGRRLTEWAERQLLEHVERPIVEQIHEQWETTRLEYNEETESEARR